MAGIGAGLESSMEGGGGAESATVAFHGPHQAGIATPQQGHLNFAAFDVVASSRRRLRALLERWTDAATALSTGREYVHGPSTPPAAPSDPGEAVGLSAARLTLTFGFGPSLFVLRGRDRFGLADRRPRLLEPLPPFPGESLDPARSNGDLCVQACADDPQVAFHAIHLLSRLAGEDATLRWVQAGFLRPVTAAGHGQTPRNLLGFKDGTDNIRGGDQTAMDRFVWVGGRDRPAWMRGGTYLIVRRIQVIFYAWDDLTLAQQEDAFGRHKSSGAPLGGRREHDPVNLRAVDAHGDPVIPLDAHIRVASPTENHGQAILRRAYSYSDGSTSGPIDRGGHQIDAGLFFIAFVRNPSRQFIPLQQRLAAHDAVNAFTIHTSSAMFACPPGVSASSFVGQQLFG